MRTLRIVSGIVVSLTAFAALGVGFVWTAEAGPAVAHAKVVGEAKGVAEAVAESEARPAAYPLPTVSAEEVEEPEPEGVEVPELTGRTALRAFRQARAAGLVAEIVDPEGNRVAPSERLYMNVTEQAVPPGEHVEDGGTVRLTARYPRVGFASGY